MTAIMNNPISEPRILLMFAFMNGLFFAKDVQLKKYYEKASAGWQ
jgi:hypothetical protein